MRASGLSLRYGFILVTLATAAACASDPGDGSATATGSGGAGVGGASSTHTGGNTGAGGDIIVPTSTSSGAGGNASCSEASDCGAGQRCRYETCIVDRGECTTNDGCPGDSYCDIPSGGQGVCVPYGVPAGKEHDETCQKPIDPGTVAPTVQCEWTSPIPGDPTEGYTAVYTSPIVADLNLDHDPNKLRPSIVVTTFKDSTHAMLRVFDGRTCTEQLRAGGPDDPTAVDIAPGYATQWAIGDLDGDVGVEPDGHPEIVGFGRLAPPGANTNPIGVVAYKIDTSDLASPKLVRQWVGRVCTDSDPTHDVPVAFGDVLANSGPGLWDLDDDGVPEVVADTMVYDAKGCLLNPPAQWVPYLRHGVVSTVADADHDGRPDLIRFDGVYGWDVAAKQWVKKPFFVDGAAHKPGHTAIADLGSYSQLPGVPATTKLPEVVVVSAASTTFNPSSTGTIRVQTLTGEVVFGPVDLFHHHDAADPLYSNPTNQYGGHGGPPTVGDFDGDGYPEFAAAANQFYVVYDPDCTADGTPAAERPGGKCDRSSVTLPSGLSSLPPGILWAKLSSDYSSSGTGSSLFDFNGDGKPEVVYRDECFLRIYDGPTGDVIFSVPARSGTGQEMPIIADVNGNFATQIVVPRTNNTSCSGPDPLFPDAPALDDMATSMGFAVLRDTQDRWASSRPIWNQQAYSVTNVTDDGRIPKSSSVARNWEAPGLNNFRQNVQGSLGALKLADITVELADLEAICAATSGQLEVSARVCNRGTNPVTDGVTIRFSQRDKGAGEGAPTTLVCNTVTPQLLDVGQCSSVSCTGNIDDSRDLVVTADPDRAIADCHPGNNAGASALVLCPQIK